MAVDAKLRSRTVLLGDGGYWLTEAGPGADGEVDMSSIGPLTLHVDRILEEAGLGRSVLVEVIAEPSSSSNKADSWAVSGWPIRCKAFYCTPFTAELYQ